jgi:hypothetical protein
MMLAVPRYDVGVCSRPDEMRSIGDQAIAGFLLKLTQLLPLVEKTVAAAKADRCSAQFAPLRTRLRPPRNCFIPDTVFVSRPRLTPHLGRSFLLALDLPRANRSQ